MAELSVAMGLDPAVVWAMHPRDVATVLEVLEDRARHR